jgi:adenine-specific DNA-methyltransferase
MAARKPKARGPKPVEAITHADKRVNLPTADAQEFVAPETEVAIPLRYPRDPTLDPQLVWKGKDELDGEDLVADAPPIYIQEKIDPRVLVENLRETAMKPEEEPELHLFETFDGLDELDLVEFYRHDANWSNRMILGDSLNVMASLAEREALRGKVQMVYVDPPYGIKFNSNWQASSRKRDVKDGKIEDASREVEQIKAFRDTWELGIHSYLTYLRDRLMVTRDLLTESGSCFVQIGDENVHLVRSVMDEVFGSENFVGLISFVTTSGVSEAAKVPVLTDFLIWYAKDSDRIKVRSTFEPEEMQLGSGNARWLVLADGSSRGVNAAERRGEADLPDGARPYMPDNMKSQGAASEPQPFEFAGKTYEPGSNSHWKANYPEGMNRLARANRVHVAKQSIRYRRFFDDFPYRKRGNLWTDTGTGNFTDEKVYVVQTNTKVVERCILMTSDPGDLVVDPTCGSGTTALSAEKYGRRWITIDSSRVALALARQRLMGTIHPYYLLADSSDGRQKESELSGTPLSAAETAGDIRHGFVYERVQHITLKSIANNPDIKDGMSLEEIDEAIRRHADFELLYDKPYEDKRKARVSGPFTVESLSPHRSLAFAGSAVDAAGARNADASQPIKEEPSGDSFRGDAQFEQTILDNLRTAGIQTGEKDKRIELETLEPYAAAYIQAVGERGDTGDDAPKRVGITIGPQYGTVGPEFIKNAAREANRAGDIDLLCVLAFAFEPHVVDTTDEYVTSEDGFASVAAERKLGRVPVLLVRMNADLVMGEELKKTGAGNLFTVFGEPDIEVIADGDELRVVLKGVDVYDPNTGELRSNDTDQIALWMIDTAYNGESFFVRHCYFTGGQDPYKRLKTALKAEIELDAWASLNATVSRPFVRPESGRIAVKVINDYGDEVMKVFEV